MNATSLTPRIASGFRLQYEPAQHSYVLLYPEGMIRLNQSAAEILKLCDGIRTITEITSTLEATFAISRLADDVNAFIAGAQANGWLCRD